MYTLAIETSTDVGTIALSCDGKLLSEVELPDKRNHSRLLISAIEAILRDNGVDKKDVAVCAVSKGPGSFTGVRIGVTAAKTLAWALGWKVAGVDSLLVRAHAALQGLPAEGKHICPTMNALNDESFYAIYDRDLQAVAVPQLITNSDFAALQQPAATTTCDESQVQPRASDICALVARFEDLISDDVHGLSPLYLKKSAAERHHDALEQG